MAKTVTADGSQFRRARPTSAFKNDKIVLNAAVQVLANQGYENFNFNSVSKEAGLSYTVLRKRYENIEALVADVWSHCALESLVSPIDKVARGYVFATSETRQIRTKALKAILKSQPELNASLEIILIAATKPEIRKIISKSFKSYFDLVCAISQESAARYSFVISMILGVLANNRFMRVATKEVIELMDYTATKLEEAGIQENLPEVDASVFTHFHFDAEKDIHIAILQAGLSEIAENGFADTTTIKIARRAGVSEGKVFSHFESKLSIFLEGLKKQAEIAVPLNIETMRNWHDQYGVVIANALFIREYLRPSKELFFQRALQLEATRLSWHRPEIEKRRQSDMRLLQENLVMSEDSDSEKEKAERMLTAAIPTGLMIVATINTEAWTYPHTVATSRIW